MSTQVQPEKRIRVTSTKSSRISGEGEVTIAGLTADEVDRVEAFAKGQNWMRVTSRGRIEFELTHNPLPGPADDEAMMPFWRKPYDGEVNLQEKAYDPSEDLEHSSPCFIIQHLCGYHYTPYNYQQEVKKLESWGFSCLRSRRGTDGKYWEVWYLSCTFLAEGDLKKEIGELRGKKAVDKAVAFLGRRASFGSLDVSVQRLAMVMD